MTNKELISKRIKENGYTIGCYNDKIEKVSKTDILKVLDSVDNLWGDVPVSIKGVDYIVEIATVDNEIDFNILTALDYENQYGRKYGED
jgi:hypothetical protein